LQAADKPLIGLISGPSPVEAVLPTPALAILTFGPIRSRYRALAAGPLDADLRRGFEIPEQSSPVSGSSFKRGLGQRRLFGSL